jgi:hypothetical protein
MFENPIVDEVHRIREQMLAEYAGDLHALIRDARRRTEEAERAGQKVYSPTQEQAVVPSVTKKAG